MKFLLHGIESARIQFEPVDEKYFHEWLEFFKDPESFRHWKQDRQVPEEECTQWFGNQLRRYHEDRGGMNALVEKSSGKLIGNCGLLVQMVDGTKELEIGYSLLSSFRGKGYALEAASACRDFAFQNSFSDSLISIISLSNTPSANVAVRNGMKVDKQTIYNANAVNIFRIIKQEWRSLQ